MNLRYMRIVVMFDLPVITSKDKREYRKFKRFLDKSGYLMLQESVYCKLALNGSVMAILEKNLSEHRPNCGSVIYYKLTEMQFSSFVFLVGNSQNIIIDSDDRYVEL